MKIYVVYFVTMENSPEWEVICATTDKVLAGLEFANAKVREEEWMADEEDDSGNWAYARIEEFDIKDVKAGDTIHVVFDTEWMECVDVIVKVFKGEDEVKAFIADEKLAFLELYPGIIPFYEDESFEKSMHLCDDSVMVDIYFKIESAVLR